MVSSNPVELSRPSIRAAAVSLTALANSGASLSLLASGFLPHSVDVDVPMNRPFSNAAWVVATSTSEDLAFRSLVLWPYELALFTFLGMLLLVVRRPPWMAASLMLFPLAFAFVLSCRWAVLLFSGAENSRAAMVIAALVAPLGAVVGARMLWLHRAGRVTAAGAWGQSLLCVLAAFSLRWFWFAPTSGLHVGGVLSIISAILMMFASWTWITRAHYDLLDRSKEPMHFQVSLRQIIISVALTAIALTYWQALGAWAR